jgi:hypothetical protein
MAGLVALQMRLDLWYDSSMLRLIVLSLMFPSLEYDSKLPSENR